VQREFYAAFIYAGDMATTAHMYFQFDTVSRILAFVIRPGDKEVPKISDQEASRVLA
jgi:hypothetical protein